MITEGSSATIHHSVAADDTALALGSGSVEVLGTPKVVALCEQAAVEAIANQLEDGMTSVGTEIAIDHLSASPVGAAVSAHAVVKSTNGRSVAFDVELRDGAKVAARGTHVRFVVDRDRFVAAAKQA